MAFQLPELPYAYDALQPYMSAETLQYHHDKHHQAYVDMGNKLLQGSGLEGKSLIDIVKGSYGRNQALFNNAGQHYNHLHFWKWMKQGGGGNKLPGKPRKRSPATSAATARSARLSSRRARHSSAQAGPG